jgi:hypothetical protein
MLKSLYIFFQITFHLIKGPENVDTYLVNFSAVLVRYQKKITIARRSKTRANHVALCVNSQMVVNETGQ